MESQKSVDLFEVSFTSSPVHKDVDLDKKFAEQPKMESPNSDPYEVSFTTSSHVNGDVDLDTEERKIEFPKSDPSEVSFTISPLHRDVDFDKFAEEPSQDFFCPVSLELLLEPQLTSCCGIHLSLGTATKLKNEGKPCPQCDSEQWQYMLDKKHRRKVHKVGVCCWYKKKGREWTGELNEVKRHVTSCEMRPWVCKYCQLKYTYKEGEGEHWSTCPKFPDSCPNGCEAGRILRCHMDQHRSVCCLEPVACEMKELGCNVVVPRKELAAHMKESGLQHLAAMTMLNLSLTKQLQRASTERDKKIAQLQLEIEDLKTDTKRKLDFNAQEKSIELITQSN